MPADTGQIGRCAAVLMEAIDDLEAVDVGTVMIIAELNHGDEATTLIYRCTDPRIWVQRGLARHVADRIPEA